MSEVATIAATVTGPSFMGQIFNVFLCGISVMQTSVYYNVYKKDPLWLKLFVGLVLVCDVFETVCSVAYTYNRLILNYGNFALLGLSNWESAAHAAMVAIIASLVQFFYAWRIKVVTGNWPLVGLIILCSVCQWCGGIGTAIAVTMIPEFLQWQRFKAIVIVWLAFTSLTDIIIAVSLVLHLRKHKTGIASTDDMIDRIIRVTVQTGMITAVCATTDLICFVATPTALHTVFNEAIPKLYANSLLSSLNYRSGWGYSSGGSSTDSAGAVQFSQNSARFASMPPLESQIDVEMGQKSVVGGSQTVHPVMVDYINPAELTHRVRMGGEDSSSEAFPRSPKSANITVRCDPYP